MSNKKFRHLSFLGDFSLQIPLFPSNYVLSSSHGWNSSQYLGMLCHFDGGGVLVSCLSQAL